MDYTSVYGLITDNQGQPYKGAIVKFSLDKSFSRQGKYYHNLEVRCVTNKYGMFDLDLPPSTYDSSGENFYHVTIILDTIFRTQVIVPQSSVSINFSDLKDYRYPHEREFQLGEGCFNGVD